MVERCHEISRKGWTEKEHRQGFPDEKDAPLLPLVRRFSAGNPGSGVRTWAEAGGVGTRIGRPGVDARNEQVEGDAAIAIRMVAFDETLSEAVSGISEIVADRQPIERVDGEWDGRAADSTRVRDERAEASNATAQIRKFVSVAAGPNRDQVADNRARAETRRLGTRVTSGPSNGCVAQASLGSTRPPAINVDVELRPGGTTVVLPICLGGPGSQPLFAVPPTGGCVFGAWDGVTALARDPANDVAAQWATKIVDTGGPPEVFAAGAVDHALADGSATVFVYIAPLVGLRPARDWRQAESTWRTLTQVGGVRVTELCELACQRLVSYTQPTPRTSIRLQLGVGEDVAIVHTFADAAVDASFDDAVAKANADIVELRAELTQAAKDLSRSPELRTFLGLCSDRVLPVPIGDIPASLKGEVKDFDVPDMLKMRFAHLSQVPETLPCPLRGGIPIEWPKGLHVPTCHAELLTEKCFDDACDLLEAFDAWHVSGARKARPEGKVWGLAGFRPEYHSVLLAGATVDFRGEGPARLLSARTTGFTTHTRAAEPDMVDAMKATKDRQSVDFMRTGVVTKIRREPCLALSPNLLTLYASKSSCKALAKELDTFRKTEGWSCAGRRRDRSRGLLGTPVLPFIASPHGGVDKSAGTPEPRVINELGWPRYVLHMETIPEEIFESNNVCSGKDAPRDTSPPFGGSEAPWAPEIKDTMRSAAVNSVILRQPADMAGWTVFMVALDLRKMFHQFFYAWHDLWMLGGIVPTCDEHGELTRELVCISNYVMAMGWKRASAVATHAYCVWNQLIARAMDKAEAKLRGAEPVRVQQWLESRDELKHDTYGTQAKLYDLLAFTDDGLAQCVGPPARVIRLIEAIYSVIGPLGLNFQLSKPSKWMVGAWSQWIGGRLSPALGLVWLPQVKVLRTDASARAFMSGTLSEAESVKLLGFLNHVSEMIMFPLYYMRTAWGALDEHRKAGKLPTDAVRCSSRVRAAVAEMRRRVMNCPGTSMLRAVRRLPPSRGGRLEWVIRGDACFDVIVGADGVVRATTDGDPPGMGGAFYEEMWCYQFSTAELQVFTIPVAEFTAFCMALCIFGRRLDYAECVVGEIDALASPIALGGEARSAGMMEAHAELRELPQFKRLTRPRPRLSVRHIWGVLNRSGDKPSRGQRAAAERLTRLLGLKPAWVGPERMIEAIAFKNKVYARLVSLKQGPSSVANPPIQCDPVVPGGTAFRFASRMVRGWSTGWAVEWEEWDAECSELYHNTRPQRVGPHAWYPVGECSVCGDYVYACETCLCLSSIWDSARHHICLGDIRWSGDWGQTPLTPPPSKDDPSGVRWTAEYLTGAMNDAMSVAVSEASTQPYDSLSNVDDWEPPALAPEPDLPSGASQAQGSLPGSSEQHGAAPADTIAELMGLGVDEHYGGYESDEYAGDDSRAVTHSQLNWGYWLALPWPESPESEPDSDDEPVQPVQGGFTRLYGGGPTVQQYAGPTVREPAMGKGIVKPTQCRRDVTILLCRAEGARPEGEGEGTSRQWAAPVFHSPVRQKPVASRVTEPCTLSRGGQRHVDHLLAFNATSTSKWRIQPRDPEVLRSVLETAARLAEYAAPKNTLNQEESAFRLYWQPYCRYLGICAERPDISQISWEEQQIEMSIWGGAISYIAARMPNKQGVVGAGKPQSNLQALRNVRREMQRPGKKLVSLVQAVRACDGLIREYIDLHGAEALLPHRKEPLTNEIIVRLLSDDFQGTDLGSTSRNRRIVDWTTGEFSSLRAMFATLAQTGMRKAEVALLCAKDFTRYHLAMGNVRWLIRGVLIINPTRAQLMSLTDGDYALLTPPPSKADQFGLHWGASTIYLRFRACRKAYPICAARELMVEELRRNVPSHMRKDVPLFVSPTGNAWTHAALNKVFFKMLSALVGAEKAGRYSIHSFRIYLACALLASGASNGTIQTMLRWKSEDALRIYARINDFKYAEWLDRAGIAAVSSVRTTTTADAVNETANAMRASVAGAPGIAEAGFQTTWADRAASVMASKTLAARLLMPVVDPDAQVAMFQSNARALFEQAEKADGEDNLEG